MSIVRDLLGEIVAMPSLLARIGDGDDLIRNGVNSGDLIRLVVGLEERHGLTMDADDLDGLRTIADFEQLADRQLNSHADNARCGANGRWSEHVTN